MTALPLRHGIRANIGQFSLLVLVNALVGAMIGMERSILPALAEHEFHLTAHSAILSFIVVFGVSKALTNYLAGRLSEYWGRRRILILGWCFAIPVPWLLIWAPSWNWILIANVLLGISQGLTWSTTVIMKIDLAGPHRRGLAMGLNEFAGYGAVAVSALVTGALAAEYSLRPAPFYLGFGLLALGLGLSLFAVRETQGHAEQESKAHRGGQDADLSPSEIFRRTSFGDPNLSSASQAGLVNNLNDGMAWGLFPIVFATAGMSLGQIGTLAAVYPGVWGLGQLVTGALSDRIGRKGLIVAGMWMQALGILAIAYGSTFAFFLTGAVLLGAGTAMVYPTLLATIGDVAHPSWRGSAVGVYRLWRDMGYAVGALLAGIVSDVFGVHTAMLSIALLTFASGLSVALRMRRGPEPGPPLAVQAES